LGGSIDGVIQWLIDNEHGDLHNPSRAPNARLELRYVLDLGGFRHRLPAVGELYRRTILDSPLDIIYLSDLEAYAITHIVFYLTDFGGRPASLTDEQMERAKETVEQLTALYLADGNWDLTAELLSCRRMLDLPPSDLTAFGWRCLAEAQASSGMIPGPHYGPGVAESMPDAVRKGIYEFRSSYHTTLVTMLAAVTWAVCDES
jgi:hypothetical protein